MNKKIYVIIVTWNGMKWIDCCLSHLRLSSIQVSTIVIDNGSTDGTIGFIKENYPEVNVLCMDRNLGFGQANNKGIKMAMEAGADFVYLLNQDAYVYPDMFELLLQAYINDNNKSRIGIVSPLHLYRDRIHFDSQFKGYLSDIASQILEDRLLGTLKPYYAVEMVPAAGWLIPVNTLTTIGGFDPIFFHYGEDDNYAQRVKYHGLSIVIVPEAKMIHDRDGFGNESMARRDEMFRGLQTYYFLNINLRKKTLFLYLCRIVMSYVYESTRCLLKRDFKRFKMYYSGLFRNTLNIPQYYRDRKMNRRKGPNWL